MSCVKGGVSCEILGIFKVCWPLGLVYFLEILGDDCIYKQHSKRYRFYNGVKKRVGIFI
jgi:hypothetical protein